ncbi:MAG: TadE family protein [Bryobacteraceae bacterium]
MKRHNKRRGAALLEFALTGPPLIFIWISTIQMALGMWHYHTLQYAVKATGLYLARHGSDCGGSNSCLLEIENLASQMKTYAIGVPATAISLTFNSVSSNDHSTVLSSVSCLLTDSTIPANGCDRNTTQWLPSTNNAVGSEFEIQAEYHWSPMIGIVTPGAGDPMIFGAFWLPAYTHQVTVF